MYPRIKINLKKLKENGETVVRLCHEAHITTLIGVVKVCAGDEEVIKVVSQSGISHVADSRLENLKMALDLPKVLLRLPMLSEVEDVVQNVQISLNSELKTIQALNDAALRVGKIHQILLMFDLGDLREGIYYLDPYINIVDEILKLKGILLKGIGTNLTCYGALIPTPEILQRLLNIKENIETHFSIHLELISGGNSSSLYLVEQGLFPQGINNLRIGEAIFLGRETAFGKPIFNLYQDVFTLEVEIIECKKKPSVPNGLIGRNAFGDIPVFEDRGERIRAICAIGKQDVDSAYLFPIDPHITIIGESSDHLIIEVIDDTYGLGDIVQFQVSYGGLLQVMTSPYIKKVYENT